MAEIIAGVLIELTISTLVKKITSELKDFTESKNVLEGFNKELEFVKALLRDAAGKRKGNARAKTWLFDLQKIFKFDAGKRRGLTKDCRKLGKKLNEINGLAKQYGIDPDYVCKEPALDDTHPESSFLYDKSETHGMRGNIDDVKKLLEDASKAQVIAVVGLGTLPHSCLSDCNWTAPSELENVANEVASQCAKLPLAIKTTAAFMRVKRNLDEWKMTLDELRNARTFYSNEISVVKGRTYLNELINRCLIEPSKMADDGEAAISCKMNDLVRDMALFISEQENRCLVIHQNWNPSPQDNNAGHKRKRSEFESERMDSSRHLKNRRISETQEKHQFVPVAQIHRLRRISLITNSLHEALPQKEYPVLRTLMLSTSNLNNILEKYLENLPLLRVLDVSRTNITSLPKSVGNLKRLEHLNASHCTQLKRLPDEIGKLEFLRHLDLTSCCNLESLPKSVVNLKRLAHLNACHCRRLPAEIGELECLNLTYCCNLESSPKSVVEKSLNSQRSNLQPPTLSK
eukprot:Gb_37039 [translate_table: standard]